MAVTGVLGKRVCLASLLVRLFGATAAEKRDRELLEQNRTFERSIAARAFERLLQKFDGFLESPRVQENGAELSQEHGTCARGCKVSTHALRPRSIQASHQNRNRAFVVPARASDF